MNEDDKRQLKSDPDGIMDSESLFDAISSIIESTRSSIVKAVNTTIVHAYYNIGRYIVEFEQNGDNRAVYGSRLLENLSVKLSQRFGKGFSIQNLRNMRQFYYSYSQIRQTPSSESPKLFTLSWSHYLKLMRIDNPDERQFYEIEATNNNWSLRELERQYDSSLYERLALSRNKEEIKRLAKEGQIIEKPADLIKDPYILEFVGLESKASYTESDLENKLIDNLQSFLLELGKGFMFVGRQYRITFSEDHFYVDLVFYNRFLRAFFLIDLKRGKLRHQDIGQMQMYVNYFDREIKADDENPSVGLLLCADKNDAIVQYTLPADNNNIFAGKYMTYLPDKESLKKLLSDNIK